MSQSVTTNYGITWEFSFETPANKHDAELHSSSYYTNFCYVSINEDTLRFSHIDHHLVLGGIMDVGTHLKSNHYAVNICSGLQIALDWSEGEEVLMTWRRRSWRSSYIAWQVKICFTFWTTLVNKITRFNHNKHITYYSKKYDNNNRLTLESITFLAIKILQFYADWQTYLLIAFSDLHMAISYKNSNMETNVTTDEIKK